MATERIELRPKRELINNDFDGYKLSLDPLPTYKTEINGTYCLLACLEVITVGIVSGEFRNVIYQMHVINLRFYNSSFSSCR